MKYYVITPAKNEEAFIAYTLESMVKQTLKPIKWIIVDDGSTDKTREIIEKYSRLNDWIEVLTIENKQEQKSYGSKVIRAFNVGYKKIKDFDFDFIVKLDADLTFPSDYFQKIAQAFSADDAIGICGGYIVENENDRNIKASRFPRVEGAVKSVRMKCFKDIGGFLEENGWDGIDLLHAQYLNWKVANIPVNVLHHRPETAEYRSLRFFYNNGVTHYRQANDLFLTFVRALVMLKKKPYFLASFSYVRGYLNAFFSHTPKLVDDGLARFIKGYHYQRLFNFKR